MINKIPQATGMPISVENRFAKMTAFRTSLFFSSFLVQQIAPASIRITGIKRTHAKGHINIRVGIPVFA